MLRTAGVDSFIWGPTNGAEKLGGANPRRVSPLAHRSHKRGSASQPGHSFPRRLARPRQYFFLSVVDKPSLLRQRKSTQRARRAIRRSRLPPPCWHPQPEDRVKNQRCSNQKWESGGRAKSSIVRSK